MRVKESYWGCALLTSVHSGLPGSCMCLRKNCHVLLFCRLIKEAGFTMRNYLVLVPFYVLGFWLASETVDETDCED